MNTVVTQLTNQELQTLLETESDLQILDVRQPEEWFHLGHLKNYTGLPLMDLPARHAELDKTKKTVVVCEHGVRSADACYYLTSLGFENLYNLTMGMAEWNGERVIPAQTLPRS